MNDGIVIVIVFKMLPGSGIAKASYTDESAVLISLLPTACVPLIGPWAGAHAGSASRRLYVHVELSLTLRFLV